MQHHLGRSTRVAEEYRSTHYVGVENAGERILHFLLSASIPDKRSACMITQQISIPGVHRPLTVPTVCCLGATVFTVQSNKLFTY